MTIIICLISVFFIFLAYLLDKKIYSPNIIFSLWWGFCLILSSFGFFGILVPSSSTYIIFLIGLLSFNIPLFLIRKHKFNSNNKSKTIFSGKNNKIILSLLIFCSVLLGQRMNTVIKLLMSGVDYSVIRYLFFKTDRILSGRYDQLITDIIINPLVLFSCILFALQLVQKKRNHLILLFSVINISFYSLSSGARTVLVYLIISIIVVLTLKSNNYVLSASFKRKSIFYIVLSVLFLFFVSFLRGGSGTTINDILKTVVVYFTGSFKYFESQLDYLNSQEHFLFGGTIIGGIVDFFILSFNLLGASFKQITSYISENNQIYLDIGNGTNYNAFATMYYTFMIDLGYFGTFFHPFIFGILSRLSFIKVENNKSDNNIGMFVITVIVIYESTLRWMGVYFNVWICLLLFKLLEYYSIEEVNYND